MSVISKIPFEKRKELVYALGYKIGRGQIDPDSTPEEKYREGLTAEQDKELMAMFWMGCDAGRNNR